MAQISAMLSFVLGSEERQTMGLQFQKGQICGVWACFLEDRMTHRALYGISVCC